MTDVAAHKGGKLGAPTANMNENTDHDQEGSEHPTLKQLKLENLLIWIIKISTNMLRNLIQQS